MKWERLKVTTVFKNRWRNLQEWIMRSPDGKEELEMYIHDSPGLVSVFAITAENQVLLLKEYYFGSMKYVDTLVGGCLDNGDHLAIAKMELKQESGYESDSWTYLGPCIMNKYSTGVGHYYIARNITKCDGFELERAEDIEPYFVSLEDFRDKLKSGKINGAYDVVGAYRALEYLDSL